MSFIIFTRRYIYDCGTNIMQIHGVGNNVIFIYYPGSCINVINTMNLTLTALDGA